MKKILLLAVIFIACFANAKAYFPPDSCLQVVPAQFEDNGSQWVNNPDSLMWDTCAISYQNMIDIYGKGKYRVKFKYNVIPRNFVTKSDSLITYTLSDILPAYSALKDSLISLSASLGTFTINDENTMYPDTSILFGRRLIFKFNNIHLLNEGASYFEQLPYVSSAFSMQFIGKNTSVENQGTLNPFSIVPNPAKNEILINLKDQLPPKEIQIEDEKGNLVLQTEFKNKIDISSLSRGVYFVKINNQIQKFIKE